MRSHLPSLASLLPRRRKGGLILSSCSPFITQCDCGETIGSTVLWCTAAVEPSRMPFAVKVALGHSAPSSKMPGHGLRPGQRGCSPVVTSLTGSTLHHVPLFPIPVKAGGSQRFILEREHTKSNTLLSFSPLPHLHRRVTPALIKRRKAQSGCEHRHDCIPIPFVQEGRGLPKVRNFTEMRQWRIPFLLPWCLF